MTQTLQQALLKAGLVSQEKLKKAEADKKAAQRAAQMPRRPERPPAPPPSARFQASAGKPVAARPQAPAEKPASAKPYTPTGKPPPAPVKAAHAAPAPKPMRREEAPPEKKKSVGFIEGKHHHHIRTHCEACGKNSPDVEYYEHRNRALDRYWLCVRCADDNNILDEFRQTMQSSHAQRGFFQRGYGPTKVFRRKI